MNHIKPQKPVALVTGASSGFGKLTAMRLSARGYRVFGTSRNLTASNDGYEMLALDVDRPDSVQSCVRTLFDRAGRLDVLVNNAGRALVGACEETSADEARALFETNVFGVMRMVSAVLPAMRAQGSGVIVNVGSISGYVGTPFHGVYAASKHALSGYSEALNFETRAFGVRVALVEPAAHRTGIRMTHPEHPIAIYDADRARVEAIIREHVDAGDDPERVADTIVAAATQKSTRLRYRVGAQAGLASWGRRVLSDRVFALLVRREFRLSTLAPKARASV